MSVAIRIRRTRRLADLRARIVKRPAITTAEALAGSIRGRTHLVTGYVHKSCTRIYALRAAAGAVRQVLDSGAALRRLVSGAKA